ncbi:MAG TPA: TraR/DksA family transcriptional regulator [Candidatus Aminicenantes bacterium]|nr:TraR/DksA family transcriptional regulator [Candidatus Aminicenantes bacterium]
MAKKLSKKDQDKFRAVLAAKRESITDKLTKTISESKEMEVNVAQDVVDKAETSYSKEFLLSLSDGERRQLLLIDEALKRLERGGFGVCQVCGKEIGAKRIAAIPWTPLCIECQEKAEAEQRTA